LPAGGESGGSKVEEGHSKLIVADGILCYNAALFYK
jgi:hypothetical protein